MVPACGCMSHALRYRGAVGEVAVAVAVNACSFLLKAEARVQPNSSLLCFHVRGIDSVRMATFVPQGLQRMSFLCLLQGCHESCCIFSCRLCRTMLGSKLTGQVWQPSSQMQSCTPFRVHEKAY